MFLSYNFQQYGKHKLYKMSPKGRNQDDLLKNQSNSHALLKSLTLDYKINVHKIKLASLLNLVLTQPMVIL